MKYDTQKKGLETIYRPYQAAMLNHIMYLNEHARAGVNSGQMHIWLKDHPDSKSRASVIFSLNDMVNDGVLEYTERTGKGGYHRVYYPKMTREQLEEHVIRTLIESLSANYPETYARSKKYEFTRVG